VAGTPEAVAACTRSATAPYLKAALQLRGGQQEELPRVPKRSRAE